MGKLTTQLSLIIPARHEHDAVSTVASMASRGPIDALPVWTIARRWTFEPTLEPINLHDFDSDMLVQPVEDKTVFKVCPTCGHVWAFNTETAYHTRLVICSCEKCQFAKDMRWSLTRKAIFADGRILDWESCQYYRLEIRSNATE